MSYNSNDNNSNTEDHPSQEETEPLPSINIPIETTTAIAKATATTTTNKRPLGSDRHNDINNHTKKKAKNTSSYLDLYSADLKYEPVYFTLEKYDDDDVVRPDHNDSDSRKRTQCLSQIRHHVIRDIHPQLPVPQANPGTPLCYYKSSYLVKVQVPILRFDEQVQCTSRMKIDHNIKYDPIEKTDTTTTGTCDNKSRSHNNCTIELEMIIHQHVNGLCVICITNIHSIFQQLIAYVSRQQDQEQQLTSTFIPNTKYRMDGNIAPPPPPPPTTKTTINDPIEWLTTMSRTFHIQFQYHIQETPSSMSMADKRKRIMKTHAIGKSKNTSSSISISSSTTHHHNNRTNNSQSNSIGLIQHSTETLASITITKNKCNHTSTNVAPISTTNATVPIKDNNKKTDDIVYGIDIPCCVLGSIIELNARYKSVSLNDDNTTTNQDQTIAILQLLQIDPYRDGYLAIVQPSGSFPPFYPSKG